tara:strand:- start:1213 stop:2910 length:1698 start_codon:yes stop_codon:yes gene_type:complete
LKNIFIITQVILLITSINLISQNKDSINSYSFDKLTDKYYEYKFTDSLKAKKYVDLYIEKADKNNDTLELMDGHLLLSDIKDNKYIYLNYLDSLIKITTKKPNKKFPAIIYLKKGFSCLIYGMNDESLINYISAVNYSTLYKNDSVKYVAKSHIGLLNVKNNNYTEAKKKYLEVYSNYKSNPELRGVDNYFSLLLNLSKTYIREGKYDSAYYYNYKALQLSQKENDTIMYNFSLYRRGDIEYKLKKYQTAINTIKKSIPSILSDENYGTLTESYNYIAKSYSKLNQKTNSIKYYLLIDSLYQKTNLADKSQKDSYKYLSNHYKERKDINNQLKYINKYLKVDSILNIRSKNLAKTFSEEYDRPKLIAEKEAIIANLKKEAILYKSSKFYLFLFLIIISVLFFYQYYKRTIQKKKFDELALKLKNKKNITPSLKTDNKYKKNTIAEDIVNEILEKLDSFEKKPDNFTNNKLTLSLLAKELETNSNYLSKVINQKKGYNFSTYLRKLRIDYALDLLEKSASIRKFSIEAIAKEVGFKNSESFSKAFHKETKLNPSYYIKQLEKNKVA